MGGNFLVGEIFSSSSQQLVYKCTKMGSDLSTDWPFTDPKWIKPLAEIRAFCPHKDWR